MRVFDAHCDVLMKLFGHPGSSFCDHGHDFQVTYEKMRRGHVKVQVFAVFVSELHPTMRFEAALAQIDLFYKKIIGEAGLVLIRSKQDLLNLQEDEVGAILALEGCDCIGEDILRLRTLIQLGVRSVGLTWNHANLVADGVREVRGAGLTQFGKEVVRELNAAHIWCDVSHLSERGFWDVMELSDYVVATHSNSKRLTPHVRNLTDDQFLAIMDKNGVVGVTFVPEFLTTNVQATVYDVLHHIEHFCSLGGAKHIGIGSDFDGISSTPIQLTSSEDFINLKNILDQYYTSSQVDDFLYGNFSRRLPHRDTV